MMKYQISCFLCDFLQESHWSEDNLFIVCDCPICKVPVYIWKSHSNFPTVHQRIKMYTKARQRFADKEFFLLRHKIVINHFHFHME